MDIYDDMADRETKGVFIPQGEFSAKGGSRGDGMVSIPKAEFVKEHKQLIGTLEKGSREERIKEARKQKKELKKAERTRKVREAGKAIAKEVGGYALGAGTTALTAPYLGPVAAGVLGGAVKTGFQKLFE